MKHFFQCTDCANHFTEMASETAARAVMSRRHAVLWAWRAHNEVGPPCHSLQALFGLLFPPKECLYGASF